MLIPLAGFWLACGAPPESATRAHATAGSAAEALLVEGQDLYARGELDSATVLFTAAIGAAQGAGDRRTEARALTWRSLAAWRTGHYADARADGEAGLALKQAVGDRQELFRSWNGLGLLAWNEGRLLDATALFDSATAAALNPEDLGKAAGNRGLVAFDLGDFTASRNGFEAMLASGRASGDSRVHGNALTNLAMLEVRVGRPDQALPLLAEARQLYRTIGYTGGEQNALGQLATAYQTLGRLTEAFAVIDTAVQLARKLNQPQEVAANLEVEAQLHRDVGESRRALALYEEAHGINTLLGLTLEQGSDFRNQAEILRSLGQGASALRAATQAIRLHRTAGVPFEELLDALLLAEITSETDDTTAARQYLNSAQQLATGLNVRTARVSVVLTEARILERAGDPIRTMAVLRPAWAELTTGGYDAEWQAWDLRAGAEMRLGRLADAAESAQNAVAAVERVRSGLTPGAQRTGFLAMRTRAYARLVEILLQLGRVDQAFGVADAMRGRALLDHLRGPSPPSSRVEQLQDQVTELDRAASTGGGRGSHEAKAQLEAAIRQARAEADRPGPDRNPPAAEAILGGVPAQARETRSALGPDQAMLVYFVGPGQSHVFVLRRDRLLAVTLGATTNALTARVRLARDMVSGRDAASADPVLKATYRELITPIREAGLLQGVRHLIVVPQGVLTYLPFAALRNPADGRYLIQDFTLSILSSATALSALNRKRPSPRTLAGGEGFAPSPRDLPASRGEVEAFRRMVAGASIRIGPAATEAEARRALESVDIVHIASHGIMNPINPLYSRVELAPGNGTFPADDGVLQVHELLDLNIGSRLVFLSGCETGLGQTWATSYRTGEDYATLGQALLYAGATGVVATLWRIDDEAAGVLAERFYRHLQSVPPGEALARAQRDLLDDPQLSAPYYWAGHQLIGVAGPAGRGS